MTSCEATIVKFLITRLRATSTFYHLMHFSTISDLQQLKFGQYFTAAGQLLLLSKNNKKLLLFQSNQQENSLLINNFSLCPDNK